MTLVVAWIHQGAAFMAGDSAVSHRGAAPADTSSFGELQLNDGMAIEEMTPKVLRLADHVLAGFSGDVRRAAQFMNLTWRSLAAGEALLQIVRQLSPAFDDGPCFRIVFAHTEGGAPRRLLYSSRGEIDPDPGHFCVLGSATDAIAAEARTRIEGLATVGDLPDDVVIAASLANLQALGVHNWLPAYRIGGAFFGAYVRPGIGATWQPPITYVLYPPNGFDGRTFTRWKTKGPNAAASLIHTRIHHEAGIVFSSLLQNTLRILPSPWTGRRSGNEWNEALRQVYPDGRVLTPDDNTSYFTFINIGKPKALVLKRRPRSGFPIKIDDGNLLLTDVFADALLRDHSDPFDCRLVIQPDADQR
jgi:hypothetical protein